MAAAIPVTFLFSRACPSNDEGRVLLDRAAAGAGVAVDVVEHEVTTDAEAERVGFLGSPTYLVAGRDPFAGDPDALLRHDACRIYVRPDGAVRPLPGLDELTEALRGAGGAGASTEAAG